MNSLPKTVIRHRRDCDLTEGPSVQHANHSATDNAHKGNAISRTVKSTVVKYE